MPDNACSSVIRLADVKEEQHGFEKKPKAQKSSSAPNTMVRAQLGTKALHAA